MKGGGDKKFLPYHEGRLGGVWIQLIVK